MNKEQIISELQLGANSWNLWRKQNAVVAINLDGADLQGLRLDDCDLAKVSLRNATISHCSLKNADLIQASFAGARLAYNDFAGAKLIATNFSDASLVGCNLMHANMLTAITRNTRFEGIDFRGHDISGLMLKGISLAASNLSGQALARMDLSGTNMESANLADADLSQAMLVGANLSRAKFTGAKLAGAQLRNAYLQGVDLRGMDLSGADFSGADLSGCDLRGADLSRAKFNEANITGCKLWHVTSQEWSLAGVRCDYAYWDQSGQEKTQYRSHEFERLFGHAVTLELRYPFRLSDHELTTLPIFIEHLAAVHWGTILRLKSISDIAGGALVTIAVEEVGNHNPTELKKQLQEEAERLQLAQLSLRSNAQLHGQLKEKIGAIREEFWPRLLELAADHERGQMRHFTVLFMDLKGFSSWAQDELSEKLALFRGLTKPILEKWSAGHANMEGDSLRVTFKNATAGLSCACMLRSVLSAAGYQLRIGVELGEVMLVHNEITNVTDLEGVSVSMAARLEASANTGEVLVSQRVRHYAEPSGLFAFTPRRAALKKGIGQLASGELVDCFSVEAVANLQDLLH